MLDDPVRVRSHIISGVFQIQRFDFECNLHAKFSMQNGRGYRYSTTDQLSAHKLIIKILRTMH